MIRLHLPARLLLTQPIPHPPTNLLNSLLIRSPNFSIADIDIAEMREALETAGRVFVIEGVGDAGHGRWWGDGVVGVGVGLEVEAAAGGAVVG